GIGPGYAILHPPGSRVAGRHPQTGTPVVLGPAQVVWRSIDMAVTLIGVDVGRHQQDQVAEPGLQAAQVMREQLAGLSGIGMGKDVLSLPIDHTLMDMHGRAWYLRQRLRHAYRDQ